MNSEIYHAFDKLTSNGIEILNNINATLQLELDALTLRNLEKIVEFANKKNNLLTSFSNNTSQRINLLSTENFSSSKEGTIMFFDACQNASLKTQCTSNWKILETTLQQTVDANGINEQVLIRNQKNIDTILSILQGKTANNILYDAKGDKGDYSGQSRIGKA